ncbi:hypothetical protein KR215_008343 [Drosophila sulfurigaster]|nr:hypothetical protein KR215_008343 [Drosophila sulfurigaster]
MILVYGRLATACPRVAYKLEHKKMLPLERKQMQVKLPLRQSPNRNFLLSTARLCKKCDDDDQVKNNLCKKCDNDDKCDQVEDNLCMKCDDDDEDDQVEDEPEGECCGAPKMPCCEDTVCVCPDPCEIDEEMEAIAAHVGGKCAKNPCGRVKDPCENYVKRHIGKKVATKNSQQPAGGTQPVK